MAVTSSYRSSDNNELHERLKWSFSCAVDKSDFLKQSKDFRTIEGWYKQAKKTSDLQMPYFYLSQPIKLTDKTFEIRNIRFPLKWQS